MPTRQSRKMSRGTETDASVNSVLAGAEFYSPALAAFRAGGTSFLSRDPNR